MTIGEQLKAKCGYRLLKRHPKALNTILEHWNNIIDQQFKTQFIIMCYSSPKQVLGSFVTFDKSVNPFIFVNSYLITKLHKSYKQNLNSLIGKTVLHEVGHYYQALKHKPLSEPGADMFSSKYFKKLSK